LKEGPDSKKVERFKESSLDSPAIIPDWNGKPMMLSGTLALKRGFCSSRNFREAFIFCSFNSDQWSDDRVIYIAIKWVKVLEGFWNSDKKIWKHVPRGSSSFGGNRWRKRIDRGGFGCNFCGRERVNSRVAVYFLMGG
jgi:hypothetical protein